VDSGPIPADSSGFRSFLQECKGHEEVLSKLGAAIQDIVIDNDEKSSISSTGIGSIY